MDSDFLSWTPLSWNEVTFWWNEDTKNFEVYSYFSEKHPAPFNYRMYRVAGVWILEQVRFGESKPYLIINEIPIFRVMSLLHCLSMCCYLVKSINEVQADILKLHRESHVQGLERIWDDIESLAQNPPEWLGSIESSFSS